MRGVPFINASIPAPPNARAETCLPPAVVVVVVRDDDDAGPLPRPLLPSDFLPSRRC